MFCDAKTSIHKTFCERFYFLRHQINELNIITPLIKIFLLYPHYFKKSIIFQNPFSLCEVLAIFEVKIVKFNLK